MGATTIEWAMFVWNVIVGCTRVSAGCQRCYAEVMAWRHVLMCRAKGVSCKYDGTVHLVGGDPRWTGALNFDEASLDAPLRRNKPASWFVNSMGDQFHEKVRDEWNDRMFAVMAQCPQHVFKILTKRPERMRTYASALSALDAQSRAIRVLRSMYRGHPAEKLVTGQIDRRTVGEFPWPLPNVWLGTSIENRAELHRLDDLRASPAAVRFVSFEPLLEDLGDLNLTGIHHAIFGGESGNREPRPCDVAWIRRGVEQCRAQGAAPYVKQLGAHVVCKIDEWDGTPQANRWGDGPLLVDRKGGSPEEWPPDLRVREFPRG